MSRKKVKKAEPKVEDGVAAIKAKYLAANPAETPLTWLHHETCPEGKAFKGAEVEAAIDAGWFNDT